LTVPAPSAVRPGLPNAFDRLVLQLLQADPDARPLNAEVVRDRLAALETSHSLTLSRRLQIAAVAAAVIYVLDTTATTPTAVRITNDPNGFTAPNWSPSGDAIYASGPGAIYRMRPDGTRIERLFEGADPVVTAEGRRVLFKKLSRRGIFARDLSGDPLVNPESRLVEDAPAPPAGGIAVVPGGFYYVSADTNGALRAIVFSNEVTQKSVTVAPVPGEISLLAVSPDRRHFAFAFVGGADSDLVELRFATARSE
jgi:hypothetical protein